MLYKGNVTTIIHTTIIIISKFIRSDVSDVRT